MQRGIKLERVTVSMRDCDDVQRFIENLRRFENRPPNKNIVVSGEDRRYRAVA